MVAPRDLKYERYKIAQPREWSICPGQRQPNQYIESKMWIFLQERELGELVYHLLKNYLDISTSQRIQPLSF